MLRRHGLDHRFIFVGDGPMRQELVARCPDGAFLGSVPHDQVAVAMASADLFLFPSATDTLGNVVLEAQASGLPVIVSAHGGPREYVRPGVTGEICGDDAHAWTLAVARLAADPPRRLVMGRAAREFALTRSWSEALRPLYAAYREAAGVDALAEAPPEAGPRRVA